jgi:uncharacterized protein YqcC (DUF446 family)
MLKPNSTQQQTSEQLQGVMYLQSDGSALWAWKPNPPSPEMVQRAQPFRADVVQMDAAIKHPTYQVVE